MLMNIYPKARASCRKKSSSISKRLAMLMLTGLVSTLCLHAQVNVTGRVADSKSVTIPGVSVVLENTSVGASTNIDGLYTISVPGSTSVLIFSFVGYKEQRIIVGDRPEINVTLEESADVLDEVVVVGYGVQKKVNVTGAVSSINFEDQALSRPISSVSASLAGLGAGLFVAQGSGQPGADGATLRIRGVGTLNDNSPLVLIDGMQGAINDLNPNDIASVSVLKDGASAAIYGSRAGSGVILITTKSGSKDGKTSITYSGRVYIMNPVNLPKFITNYADYMGYSNESGWQAGADAPTFTQADIDLWREKSRNPNGLNEFGFPNYVAYPNTNWLEEVYNLNSIKQEHNVSMTGSSGKARYLMSMGYIDNPGLVDYSGLERISMRVNLESDVTKWLTVGARVYGNKDIMGRLDFDGGGDFAISRWLMQTLPGMYPYFDGKYGATENERESTSVSNMRQRLDTYANGKIDRFRLNTTAYARFKIIEGLTWDVNLNYEHFWAETNACSNPAAARTFSFSKNDERSPATASDLLTTSNNRSDVASYTLEHLLNFSRTFAKDHDVTALIGYQEYYYKNWSNGASRRGLIDENIHTVSSGTEVSTATGTMYDRASRSLFGRLTYAYKSRYLFEFNSRYDGHSRFHKDYRWGTFPSVSAGWRVSEESFMESTRSWMNNLKLRLSWGLNGNYGGSSVGDYEYQGGYASVLYPFGETIYSGLIQNEISNPLLSWESTDIKNLGIEANFLRNRLSFEFDVFMKETTGILYRISIPLAAGDKTAPLLNLAEMQNKGYEFTVGWKDRIGKFAYSVSGNLGYSSNVISKYKGKLKQGWVTDEHGNTSWESNLDDVSQGGDTRVIEDRMMGEYFLRTAYSGNGTYNNGDGTVNPNGGPKDGMIRTEADMDWVKAMDAAGYSFQSFATATLGRRDGLFYGDYIYADNNGDKVYGNAADRLLLLSSSTPKYVFGFQIYGEWNGIDLSMNFAGAADFKLLMRTPGYNSTLVEYGRPVPEAIAKDHYFYDPANPTDPRTNINAKYPRITRSTANANVTSGLISDIFLYKGDYLKLKNLTLGYSFPQKWTSKIGLEKARIYYSGENLFSIDSFPGVDPEQGASPRYQPIRQHAFGINLTF